MSAWPWASLLYRRMRTELERSGILMQCILARNGDKLSLIQEMDLRADALEGCSVFVDASTAHDPQRASERAREADKS